MRGESLSAAECRRLPWAMVQRVMGRLPPKPWIASSAISWLDDAITPEWAVFEFGSGHSTEWYARRADSVVSVEDDVTWCARVRERLRSSGLTNYSLIHTELDDFPSAVGSYPIGSFDLVVVDSSENDRTSRLDCIAAARHAVKPGGYLLLDDSDRPRYSGADAILPGWSVRRFVGLKSYPLAVTETSVYRRPLRDSQH
jgi:SAM-dependent methyltransferase